MRTSRLRPALALAALAVGLGALLPGTVALAASPATLSGMITLDTSLLEGDDTTLDGDYTIALAPLNESDPDDSRMTWIEAWGYRFTGIRGGKDYRLTVHGDDALLLDETIRIEPGADLVANRTITLRPSTQVSIDLSTPMELRGVPRVLLYTPAGTFVGEHSARGSGNSFSFRTRATGEILIKVEPETTGYLPTYVGPDQTAASSAATARRFNLEPGGSLTVAVPVRAAATITGHLAHYSADTWYWIDAELYAPDGTTITTTGARVETDGSYSIVNLEPGTYLLSLNRPPSSTSESTVSGSPITGRFYSAWTSGAAAIADATSITLVEGESVSGIDFDLDRCATITGTVIGVSKRSDLLTGNVRATNLTDAGASRIASLRDTEGHYELSGLVPGHYKVTYLASSFLGLGDLSFAPRGASDELAIASCGTTTDGVDFDLSLKNPTTVVHGEPRVGETLTVVPARIDTVGNPVVTYRWLLNGAEIPGATSASYRLAPRDANNNVSVRIHVETTHHQIVLDETTPELSVGVGRAPVALTRAFLHGKVIPGSTITAYSGRWSPALNDPAFKDAAFTYRWFRDGKVLPGFTAPRFIVRTSDVGARISAEVILVAPGYEDGTSMTAASAAVPRSASTVTAKVARKRLTGGQSPRVTVRVNVPGASTARGTVVVKMGKIRRAVTVKVVRESARVVVGLPRANAGKHTIKVSYTPSETSQVIRSSAKPIRVKVLPGTGKK